MAGDWPGSGNARRAVTAAAAAALAVALAACGGSSRSSASSTSSAPSAPSAPGAPRAPSATAAQPATGHTRPRIVLVLTQTLGYHHASIPAAKAALGRIAARDGHYRLVFLPSATKLTPDAPGHASAGGFL